MKSAKKEATSACLNKFPAYNAENERQANVIGSKINDARREAGLSYAMFSELLERYGVFATRSAVNKWITGDTVPNAYQLLAICHALNMDVDISMLMSNHIPDLNSTGLKKIQDYRDDLVASGKYKPQPKVIDILEYIQKPVSNLSVSAGTGAFLDEGNFEMVSFPKNSVPENADFGVRVSGNSMEPVYHDGQIVWVQRCDALLPGQVGIFVCDGEGFIKMYDEQEPNESIQDSFIDSSGRLHMQPVLVSYNTDYERKVITPTMELHIVGRVL